MTTGAVLADGTPPPGLPRAGPGARAALIAAARHEAHQEPASGPADLLGRWRRLAGLGRRDLVLGRLVEGHLDARSILAEADRPARPGAVHGVWASGSARTGLTATPRPDGAGWRLTGTMRFCSGAPWIDRALVTARTPDGELLLFDADVRSSGWSPVEDSWPAVGMDLSESLDVEVDAAVPAHAQVGPAGFYLERPGFAVGGIGVAAVWLGGAAGVLDVVTDGLRRFGADPHPAAHLGAMHTAVAAAAAMIDAAARQAPVTAPSELPELALLVRSAVDAAVTSVLTRAPRVTGPTPLCRDAVLAHRIADLQVYVRQHHAERDLQELGEQVLAGKRYGVHG
jgi:hypothetical protein